jgi:NTE family protein
VIVATSAKANGAFSAIRPKSVETADEPAAIWHVRRTEVFPSTRSAACSASSGRVLTSSGGSVLRQLVAKHLERGRLEELPILPHVVAIDVVIGDEPLLSSGPVVDAVMASVAIPGGLPPVA